jgi:stringent starvation protein B
MEGTPSERESLSVTEPASTKPYLLRALYEWCVDNGYTPYLSVLVDAQTRVPTEYVRNGEIVLNIGPLATSRLKMGNEFVEFAARFGGVARDILVPVSAVSAIYARENGHGMSFEVEKNETPWEASGAALASAPAQETENREPPSPPPSGKPTLRRVK